MDHLIVFSYSIQTLLNFPITIKSESHWVSDLIAAKKFGVTEVPAEAVSFISHATQARLRTMLERVSAIAQHRMETCKVRAVAPGLASAPAGGRIALSFPESIILNMTPPFTLHPPFSVES